MAYINGNDINNWLFGTSENDQIYGRGGNDRLYGGYGNDTLSGGTGNDSLYGGAGDDLFLSSSGEDSFYGDTGNDTFLFAFNFAQPARIDGGIGRDTVDFSWASTGQEVYLIASNITNVEDIRGSSFDDRLVGDDAPGGNMIDGQNGNDTIFGRDGNDTLIGGNGADFLSGGDDKDLLIGGNGDDRLDGGFGQDTVTGGSGADRFVFFEFTEFGPGNNTWAIITDFNRAEGDKIQIDLSYTGFGLGDTQFIGGNAFSGAGKEVRVTRDWSDLYTAHVSIDADGDGLADGNIVVRLANIFDLPGADDFLLS